MELQYPDLPCLHVGQKERHVYVPMECLRLVAGQRCVKKLNEQQTSKMIKAVAKPAYRRKEDILSKVCTRLCLHLSTYDMCLGPIDLQVRCANFHDDPYLGEFGITVSNSMTQVEGRVLDPPKLKCKDERTVSNCVVLHLTLCHEGVYAELVVVLL